jgi:O-antigen ligase
VAWSTLAVGGVYLWGSIPIAVLALVLLVSVRPRIAGHRDTRLLDLLLVLALGAAALQAIPLPYLLRLLLSPAIDVDRLKLLLMPDAASTWRSLSLDPPATALAAALVAACLAMFWSCRHLSGRGHALTLAHAVAVVGLVGAVTAVIQRAVDPERIYALWLPQDAGARPFGPFVNRNHFATWLLMAAPVTAGALGTMGLRGPVSARWGWAAVSTVAMLTVLVLSFSRSALAAAAAGAAVWCVLGYRRTTRRGLTAGLAAAAALAALVVWVAPAQPILARVRETLSLGTAGRGAIWADARTVAGTYPLTGTGLGTFERSMLIYQTSDRRTRTNQAHSQYLQLAAEGGALVTIPAACVCLAFLWLALKRLREDESAAVWLRIGSLAGLAGVSVQGLWETGLRMPANAILLALAAALAVHRPLRVEVLFGARAPASLSSPAGSRKPEA